MAKYYKVSVAFFKLALIKNQSLSQFLYLFWQKLSQIKNSVSLQASALV